jgi:hypothetical protein
MCGSEFMIGSAIRGRISGRLHPGHLTPPQLSSDQDGFAIVHFWFPANAATGPSIELDIGWFEW